MMLNLRGTTMSDESEKTCPLCAEEMDLTDQQLKPCKCGYEICVWCWHHIMEMAEKDETEGRCPACRTSYDKERIVGTTAKCERLVAESSVDKKHKSQKAKSKTSESRKQLTTVRVIQKNLVYIIGLPLDLADEDLLQQKEYFGQYGKVLKVSMSRTSAGTIQQFPNSTCSVYITYSKEEEAVRCIQSVHEFMLDGRLLRACFGTTKYCHAWLRNVPCNNPDCLYLHEIGSDEDSFTKDEVVSAYTRSRVQQITGFTTNTQQRSGTLLPPPADDYFDNSSPVVGQPVVKNPSNVPATSARCSPPTSSSSRSGALPPAASWGSRASNCNSSTVNSLAYSNGQTKQKVEVRGLPENSTTVTGSTQVSMWPNDSGKKYISNDETNARKTKNKLEVLESEQHGENSYTKGSDAPYIPPVAVSVKLGNQLSCPPEAESNSGEKRLLLDTGLSVDSQPCSSGVVEGEITTASIDERAREHSNIIRPNGLCLDNFLSHTSQGLQRHDSEKLHDCSSLATLVKTTSMVDPVNTSAKVCDWISDVQDNGMHKLTPETEDDFDNQRLRDAIVVNQATMSTPSPLYLVSHLGSPLQQHADAPGLPNYYVDPASVKRKAGEGSGINSRGTVVANGYLNHFGSYASGQGNSCLQVNGGQGNANVDSQSAVDLGENSIISNILDLNLWDDSLTSPQNLAEFLGETDKQDVTTKVAANPRKGQISNQSRFSFARQDESRNHFFDCESPLSNTGQGVKNHSFGQSFVENREPYLDRFDNGFGYPQRRIEPSDNLASIHSGLSSSKLSFSRSQISAPPGFSVPNRPLPPPGFPSHDRNDQVFDIKSGNHLFETSSLSRNPYQASLSGNISSASDIELIDPAILAVGRGRFPSPNGANNSGLDTRPNFHAQTPSFENDLTLQLLMQRSLSPHQNLRYTEPMDNLSPVNNGYGFTSRHMEQSQTGNLYPFPQFPHQQNRNTVPSNGHWDGWSGGQVQNDISVAELLRNDKLGFNKFGMANSGDLYNRSFRM